MKIAFFEITDFEKQKFIDAFGTDETVFFEDTIQRYAFSYILNLQKNYLKAFQI